MDWWWWIPLGIVGLWLLGKMAWAILEAIEKRTQFK
jgi:hypothetical protein